MNEAKTRDFQIRQIWANSADALLVTRIPASCDNNESALPRPSSREAANLFPHEAVTSSALLRRQSRVQPTPLPESRHPSPSFFQLLVIFFVGVTSRAIDPSVTGDWCLAVKIGRNLRTTRQPLPDHTPSAFLFVKSYKDRVSVHGEKTPRLLFYWELP